MKWEKVRLKDICESIADGDHQPPPKSINGIPFVTIANITDNKIDFSKSMFVSNDYYENLDQKRRAQKDDILYSVVGTFGIPVFIKEYKPFVFQRHIAILRPNKNNIDAKFLYYMMLSKNFYMKADSVAIGAAQRTITLNSLRNIEVDVPKIETQRRIADILSTYDDLIENNQKQIKLLEEAVQRLYKEWFVDLRFPGYEQTKIIDGVPEGWKQEKIDDIFLIKYGKTLPVSKIKQQGKYPVYGANGILGYYEQKNCNDYVVLVTSRGNGSGTVSRTHDKESFVTNNSFIISPLKQSMCVSYIYCLMKQIDFKSICTGSAQPQLTNNSISMITLLIPSDRLIKRFCEVCQPFYLKIEAILEQNNMLKEARDRLLPKLMSGEIEV